MYIYIYRQPAIFTMPPRVRRTFALLRSRCIMFLEWMKYLRRHKMKSCGGVADGRGIEFERGLGFRGCGVEGVKSVFGGVTSHRPAVRICE
jgi:hypothetical protein